MPANCRLDFPDSFRTVCACFPAAMATRNKEFPIVIKAGSSAVKIYKETKPNGEYYQVCCDAGGKRERLTFSSLEEASVPVSRKSRNSSSKPRPSKKPRPTSASPSTPPTNTSAASIPNSKSTPAAEPWPRPSRKALRDGGSTAPWATSRGCFRRIRGLHRFPMQ